MTTPILLSPTSYELRGQLEEMVLHELLGPAGGSDEEVNERHVYERYLVGMLAPLNNSYEAPGADDELAAAGNDDGEEGAVEAPNPFGKTIFPSSLGLTFCVDGDAPAIQVTARWGRYDKAYSETLTTDKGNPKRVWKREQIEERKKIALREGDLKAWEVRPAIVVTGIARRQDNQWIVSLFLVNGQQETETNKDSAWLFQPELIVEAPPYGDSAKPAIFCRRSSKRKPGKSDPNFFAEEMAMEMLYRKRTEFAIGHGVSVHATPDPGNYEQAIRIETRVVPAWEVAKVTPPGKDEIPALAGLALSMKELAETPDDEFAAKLNPLAESYEQWIEEQAQKIPSLDKEYETVAQQANTNCRNTLNRIKEGITLISTNAEAAEAFRFANRAMYLQRVQSLKAMKRRAAQGTTLSSSEENPTWYPFQLAFLLLNLPSLTDLNHPDRISDTNAVSDLLWFPTGGGKTEAYLGLTAYTLGIRRLQGDRFGRDGGHGVAVLMRYTLRLLTLQQFQRASALICACEAIRRDEPEKWGENPFRIGLWVGGSTTPNKTGYSKDAIEKIRANQAYQITSGTPHQLTNCPWCGYAIDPKSNIIVDSYPSGSARTIIYCGDPMGECLFSSVQSEGEGLPVMVVDEEIYRRLPSLLIATVDKFAQMPWNGATQMLFGQVNGYCDRHGFRSPEIEDKDRHNAAGQTPRAQTAPRNALRPPDLIIQDELHLISGPLGSLVGLYETAVDNLCSWEVNGQVVRPKVIASTATIRQAREQIYSLFLRNVQIFPPQGIDIEDNFFSRQRETGEQYPGRRYLGICAPGKRLKAALIRVYVAQLSAAQALYEKYGSLVDPWMTLVGYFNSIRELGGMRRMIDDDVASRLLKMDKRGMAIRRNLLPRELTSRIGSTDIPFILDQLEKTFDPAKDPKEIPPGERPIDVLLATNMISVGVDVSRLGVMIAAGQPKSTAEYIQATSRVGRSKPGLVITVYNWSRPRDLSHYEGFENFHARFYQHVEALSVTPFSSGAVDRGLAALLVSLVRLRGIEFNGNERAATIQSSHPVVQAAIKNIAARAANVAGNPTGEFVEQSLKSKLDVWLKRAKPIPGGDTLGYKTDKQKQNIGLLQDPYVMTSGDFVCLQSLRNVEPLSNLLLRSGLLDAQPDRLPQAWEQPATPPADEYAEEDGE